jgi:hypothetical protein
MEAYAMTLIEPSPTPRQPAVGLEIEGRCRVGTLLRHNIDKCFGTALTEINPIVGKLDKTESHLKTC